MVDPYLEKSMLKNRLNTTKRLNHIRPVRVQIPQLAVVSLRCPPERIPARKVYGQYCSPAFPLRQGGDLRLHVLIDLKLHPSPKPLIKTQRAPILLKQRVNPRQPAVPTILQILERQSPILLVSF